MLSLQWKHREGSVWRLQMSAVDDAATLSLDRQAIHEMQEAIDAAHAAGVRVLVLEGQEGCFCQGMDLKAQLEARSTTPEAPASADELYELEMHSGHPPTASSSGAYLQVPPSSPTETSSSPVFKALAQDTARFATMLLALREAPFVVIALVDGDVMAGGVGLMSAADLVLATTQTRVGLPESTLGLLPAMVLPLLQERVAPQKARLLAMRGASIDASKAEAWGALDQVFPDVEAMEKQLRRELRMFLRAHPKAIADLKRTLQPEDARKLRDAMNHAANYTAQCLALPDRLEGIRCAVAGASPPWHERPARMSRAEGKS